MDGEWMTALAAMGGGVLTLAVRWLLFGRQDSAATLAGASRDVAESYSRLVDELQEMREGQKKTIAEMFAWKREAQARLLKLESGNWELQKENEKLHGEVDALGVRLAQVEKESTQLRCDLIDAKRDLLRELRERQMLRGGIK